MEKAASLARKNNIIVNSNLKKQRICSDRAVVIKKISMDMPKKMIIAAVSEFGQVVSIRVQLIGLWQKTVVEFAKSSQADQLAAKWLFLIRKDSVRVVKAVGDHETWTSKDRYKVLLFTLPVRTTAHDLGDLLAGAGKKTCVINWSLDTGNRVRCAVVCFENNEILESAFHTEPIFGGVKLSWARLDLVWCEWCEKLGHSVLECDAEISASTKLSKSFKRVVSDENCLQLAKLYAKKGVSISRLAAFGGKSWTQVVSLIFSSDGSHLGSGSGFGSSSGASGVVDHSSPVVSVNSFLETHLASLEHSLELFTDKMSGIVNKLDNLNLVPMALISFSQLSVISVMANVEFGSNMVLDDSKPVALPSFLVSSGVSNLGLSSSKILTSKVGCLDFDLFGIEEVRSGVCWFEFSSLFFISMSSLVWRIVTCNVRGVNIPAKQDNVVRWHIMNRFPGVCIFTSGLDAGSSGAGMAHVSKIDEIPGQLISIRLLFKSKLLVTILGIYTDVSANVRFGQAFAVNSMIASAINSSSFVILDGDFNESDTKKSASLRKCVDLGLVNSFKGHSLASSPTWSNFRDVKKVIDYIFVNENLVSALMKRDIGAVLEFFDTDHKMISLNSICKQANRNRWKFDFKNADSSKWLQFKDNVSAALFLVINSFLNAKVLNNLDKMWDVLCGVMMRAADTMFSRHWFSEFDCSRNRHSLRFLGLELLIAKIIKSLNTGDKHKCDRLIKRWFLVNCKEAFKFDFLVQNRANSVEVFKHLSQVRKFYRKSKYHESRMARDMAIQSAINKCMENFSSNKSGMIRSVLEQPFHKVVLDHLVIGNELVLDPIEVKSRVDSIMVNWTREHMSPSVMPSRWVHQYAPLDYVKDDVFSDVMNDICFNELVNVILNLSDDKAAGLSAWVSMIPKPYEWNGILTNTRPIALIETARKILSKLLSDCISSACSRFDVLWGDNFSVLKGTSTQSPVFVVGLIVEDALEKNKEDMHKAYDSVGWWQLEASLKWIKMCNKFVLFFGNLHVGRVNRVMTDFGLSDGYSVLDGLDQEKRIFYDSLLCEVKNHEHLYGYRINTNFVAKSGRIESSGGWSSFLVAGAFVDDTIWIGNGQASTQRILDIVDKFFEVNNIAINSEKTVAIPINKRVSAVSLHINGLSISIAKQGEAHRYLGIFLSTDGLSKPSLAKAQLDVRFFSNMVLRKTLTDKQFVYLVSSVLQPIVSYRTKFSFVSKSGLKFKANLPQNFPSEALYHPSLYGMKTFEQIQAEGKAPLNLLQYSVKLRVSPSNNFLAGVVRIFLDNDICLANNLLCAFRGAGCFFVSTILGSSFYFGVVPSLKHFGVAFSNRLLGKDGSVLSWRTFHYWKRLSSRSSVLLWYSKVFAYMNDHRFISSGLSTVSECLHESWSDAFTVYTDGSLSHLGTAEIVGGAAAYFPNAGVGIGVEVSGLLSSIMVELHTIALVLECVLFLCSVVINTDSQTAIDACVSELSLIAPDFRNKCWVERHYIRKLIEDKDLSVGWVKVKSHSGNVHNDKADALAGHAVHSDLSLPMSVRKRYIMTHGQVAGPGSVVIDEELIVRVDWKCMVLQVIISVVELNNKPKVWYLKVLVDLKVLLWSSLYNRQRFSGNGSSFPGVTIMPNFFLSLAAGFILAVVPFW
ncbi:hypothetical protein G9A89_013870 [Geosiphon pyriformis]|nr:hypothetical protein G9A89_013870 [Geosiphon pyriformis]